LSERDKLKSLKIFAKRVLSSSAVLRLQQIRNWWRKRRNLFVYAGDNVECPLCDLTFDRFASTGVLEREFWRSAQGKALLKKDFVAVAQKMCPNCHSSERQRLQYFFLRDRLKIFNLSGLSLLDVAPDGFLTAKLYSHLEGQYISMDITTARDPKIVTDLTQMAFSDCSFDAIICYHVLEHIPDDRKAMRELFRVLKPAGWAILQVPIWAETTVEDPEVPKSQYENVYGHRGHVRRYGMDYVDRLREVGFEVTLDYFARQMLLSERERFGIDPAEILFVCRRNVDDFSDPASNEPGAAAI
jgi:SAM-dependent methyltransferase